MGGEQSVQGVQGMLSTVGILGKEYEQARRGADRGQGRQEHVFLSNLVRELFQTEQSARTHPLVEAERLGDVPPAHALRAVSAHAEGVLAELPGMMKAHDLPVSEGGRAMGNALSGLRDHLIDLLVNEEKSYRGTLIGMRHGIDLVELIRGVALVEGNALLATWCAGWIETRRPLVEAVARELAWFAAHPERAMGAVKNNPVAHAMQALVNGFEQVADKLGHLGSADGSKAKSADAG